MSGLDTASLSSWVYSELDPLPAGQSFVKLYSETNIETNTLGVLVGVKNTQGEIVKTIMVFRGSEITGENSTLGDKLTDGHTDIQIMDGQEDVPAFDTATDITRNADEWLRNNQYLVGGYNKIDKFTGQSLGGGLAQEAALRYRQDHPGADVYVETYASINADKTLSQRFPPNEIAWLDQHYENVFFSADHITGTNPIAGGSSIGRQIELPSVGGEPDYLAISRESPSYWELLINNNNYWYMMADGNGSGVAVTTAIDYVGSKYWHNPERFVEYYSGREPGETPHITSLGSLIVYMAAYYQDASFAIGADGTLVISRPLPATTGQIGVTVEETYNPDGMNVIKVYKNGQLVQHGSISWESGVIFDPTSPVTISLEGGFDFVFTGNAATLGVTPDGKLRATLGAGPEGLSRTITFNDDGSFGVSLGGGMS
ncbi:alpha/beta hydrolase family protein [Oleomonas cavernae]|uniref:hypothetical protein n=1 Tax=Oleomonas cavernae TaxID=2320859 RepID=UPI0011C443AC|nr:hypothetical protein [Oleomonas cavernae]